MNDIRPRGPIARFFVGLWDAMNFTRRLVFNLLFFGLLLIVLVAIASGDTAKPLLDRTTLVIAPEGKLVEQYSTDAASRAFARMFGDEGKGEVQLREAAERHEGVLGVRHAGSAVHRREQGGKARFLPLGERRQDHEARLRPVDHPQALTDPEQADGECGSGKRPRDKRQRFDERSSRHIPEVAASERGSA